ncbi:hypothetical protein BH09VER1_BH09VER1_26830 [soil metagenome]
MDFALKFSTKLRAGILALLSLATASTWANKQDVDATVVIFNSADPVSASLAQYYAKKRSIADDHVVGIKCPLTQEISREEYNTTIAAPVKDVFLKQGWWTLEGGRITSTKIRYVALIRGMPLKVRTMGPGAYPPRKDLPEPIASRDEASVDSELAALGLGDFPPVGLIPNSYFKRFTPILESLTDPGLLLVCRLDAPNEATVRSMIDSAIVVEGDGLWGWCYVDSRGIQDPGYKEGDDWLKDVATECRAKGIPVLWDKAPETLPLGYPVTNAALYFGWYADAVCGPFSDPGFRFRPGAIAVHIHSFSAVTLRDPNGAWCGPLLEHGAAATLGNVYEPYLTLTAHLDIFQDRLLTGLTFAESAYMSMRALSWMGVAIGDPLYRPYKNLDRPAVGKPTSWAKYRNIVLAADGNVMAAAAPLTQAAQDYGNSMFLESLGAVEADALDFKSALQSVDLALAMKNEPEVRFRLALEKISLLRALGRNGEAGTMIISEQGRTIIPAQLKILQPMRDAIYPPTPTPVPVATPRKK